MASTLGDLLDGAKSSDFQGDAVAFPGGTFTLMYQGYVGGSARVVIEFNNDAMAGDSWGVIDPALNIRPSSPKAVNFILAPCQVRARLEGADDSNALIQCGMVQIGA